MTHRDGGRVNGRRIVVLPQVHSNTADRWERAQEIDPDRTAWAEVVSIEPADGDMSRVTLAVSENRYREFAEGRQEEESIIAAIGLQFEEDTWTTIFQGHQHDVVEHSLRDPDLSYFGPHTIVVTWPVAEAFSALSTIENGIGDVACIELTRLGPMGTRSVTVAVSVSRAIYEAVTRKCVQDPSRPVADVLYEAIEEAAYGVPEHRPPTPVDHDELPF